MPEELEPFVVYCLDEGQMRCAIWQLEQGSEALALFHTAEAAEKYRGAAALGDAWGTLQPARNDLVAILEACQEHGILYAVLNPEVASARQIFAIDELLTAAQG